MKKQVIEITVNGETYPCHQLMGAMLRYKAETGEEVTTIKPTELTKVCMFMWCCVRAASKFAGKEFNLSFEDFADSVTPEQVTEWLIATMGEKKDEEKAEEDDGQKKKVRHL
jgi:hypothetical protein